MVLSLIYGRFRPNHDSFSLAEHQGQNLKG